MTIGELTTSKYVRVHYMIRTNMRGRSVSVGQKQRVATYFVRTLVQQQQRQRTSEMPTLYLPAPKSQTPKQDKSEKWQEQKAFHLADRVTNL